MISARGLTRRFGNRVAVEDLSLDVAPGEIFGLLGPNGAGKTTTLRMLAGLIAPDGGEATVGGLELRRDTIDEVRGRVGFLTEAPGLWDRLTVRQNLLVYARLYGVARPEHAVAAALDRFDLADRASSEAGQLSKGMKQKVAIARALMHDPPVVLLDEPTSGLDPQTARLVRELVLELRGRGRSIVVSTHNLDEAERLSDRIGVLRRRFIAVDTPARLRRRLFGHRVRVDLAGEAAPFVDALRAAGAPDAEASGRTLRFTVDDAEADTPPRVRALVEAGAAVVVVRPEDAPLEEIYLALVAEAEDDAGRPA